ncbi:MAG: ATP-grasp domain-containing protein [Lachnospiraceae bacterium]
MRDLTVLVSACGAQFMPGLADCLKQNGERNIRIIGVDMGADKTILQMVDAFYQVPRATDSTYVDRLLEICKREKVDVVMPFMSAELIPLIDRKAEFEDIDTKVSVSDRRSVEITNNKYRFYEFLKENNLPVPKFCVIKKADDLVKACEVCGYPDHAVCIKATELSGSRGIRIVKPGVSRYDLLFGEKPNSFYTTMEELQETLKEKKTIPEMMAMEYLPGMEGSVDLLAENGKILYMAYRESTVNLHSIPQAGELKDNSEAYEIAEKVIAALKLTGNADLDFKNDADGHPVLLEINPRIAATMKIFKEGGLNLPYLRIKHLLGEKLPEVKINYGIKMKRRYLEMFSI